MLLSTTLLTAQTSAVETEFRKGSEAMRAGNASEAEQHFREAVRMAPRLADAHMDLSLVLAREGKLEEAIASARKAVALNPKIPGGELFLGIFLHQQNREDEARKALQIAAEQDPKNIEPLMWLATVDLATGRPEAAAVSLDRAAEISPNDETVLETRGRAHSLVAQESYSRMAKIHPDSWHVHRVRAQGLAEEGKHSEAAAEYQMAVQQEPANPDLWEGMGEEYRAANEMRSAQKAFAKELELAPKNLIAMYNLGSVDVELGEAASGVPLLLTMVNAYGRTPVSVYYLGRGLAANGDNQEAAHWLELSAGDTRNEEIAKRSYYELARVYRKLQQTDKAQAATAQYNHMHEAERVVADKQAEDWRKLGAAQPATAATP